MRPGLRVPGRPACPPARGGPRVLAALALVPVQDLPHRLVQGVAGDFAAVGEKKRGRSGSAMLDAGPRSEAHGMPGKGRRREKPQGPGVRAGPQGAAEHPGARMAADGAPGTTYLMAAPAARTGKENRGVCACALIELLFSRDSLIPSHRGA